MYGWTLYSTRKAQLDKEAREHLEDVDDFVAQDVIEEAKLDAWQSYSHSDLVDVSEEEYEYQPPFETPSLQSVLVDNDALAEAGVEFTPVHEIDFEYDDGDFDFCGQYISPFSR